ncbi:hypothetical protein [Eoetvoesiella caeni]
MPILEYHLTEDAYSDEQIGQLLVVSSSRYAEVLGCPIERVRVVAHMHKPKHMAVAGKLVSSDGAAAPYFHFLVLEGRPLSECQQLLMAFSELVVSCLGAQRELVRGGCWPIPPHYWAIAGQPASSIRADEIGRRAKAESAMQSLD